MSADAMEPLEFRPYPKTPRLNREIVVTEKIDGTNGAIVIEEWEHHLFANRDLAVLEASG